MEKRATDRRIWRLLIKNTVRQKGEKEKRRNGNHSQLTPDDREEEKNNKMHFDPSLVTGELLF